MSADECICPICAVCDKKPDRGYFRDSDNDEYKDFLQIIRRKELEQPILLLDDDSTENLKRYVQALLNVKLVEEYHLYYGEIKNIVNSFLNFHTTTINEIIKSADTYSNVISRDDLLMLVEKTINTQQAKQIAFRNGFLPVNISWEKQMYEDIERKYDVHMKKLNDMKEFINVRLDKQFKIDDFAKEHFPIVVRKMSELFDIANMFIGTLLVDKVSNTRISLEEILLRLRHNLTRINEERDKTMSGLVDQLYEKTKESMSVKRNQNRNTKALAEACRGVDQIKVKISNYHVQVPTERLEKEVEYWSRKLDYFNEIAGNLDRLKVMQVDLVEEEQKFLTLNCEKISQCRIGCRAKIHKAYKQRKEEVRQRIVNETRAMFTFYAVRGSDRILYTDNIGPYYVDEFNHQNYCFDYGMEIQHRNCEGEFTHFPDHPYLFDKNGRYIVKDGVKLYQCAPCTSLYKLNEANCLLNKVTEDCGHSERVNKRCRVDIRDTNDVEVLPDFDLMDIKRTLDTETVRYLWDSFGSILPDALNDVGRARPKNPIHYLAHKVLHHKYKRTTSEQEQKEKEAEQYRADIYKKRKEKAEVASRLWKSKQVKRRKPEESDDAEFRAYLDARLAQDLFTNSLNLELYT